MPITTSIILDTRRPLKSGRYPVKLRVCDGVEERCRYHKVSYHNIKLTLSESDWKELQKQRLKTTRLRELKRFLLSEEERARDCVMQLRPFTFAGFKRLWIGEKQAGTLRELAEEKRDIVARSKSRKLYDTMLSKVEAFDKRELLPHDIDFAWLRRFEKHLDKQGLGRATIINRMRYVRAVINYAVSKGVLPENLNPFGTGANQYTIGVPQKTVEKTLTQAELRKLFAYEATPGSFKHFSLTLFRLSFYLSGANPADLFRLTQDNIVGNRIIFTRRKTANTSRSGRKVIAAYTQVVQELFRALHDPKSPYLIPLLKEGMSEEEETDKIASKNIVVNRNLQKIAKELRIDKKVTMGYARATFATVLRDNGYTSDQIANLMGNSEAVVSKHYYGTADEEKITEIHNSLHPESGGRATDT